jgi:uncharacterized repeat protein (TIGR01451 family)
MVTVSVPPPIVAGVTSTYTLTFTNTTSSPLTNVVAEGSLPSGVSLQRIGGCARLGGNQAQSILCSLPNLQPGASDTATFSILASDVGTDQLQFGASGGAPVPGVPGALQGVGDSVTLPVTVQPGPTDIQVTGSSNNGSPPVGGSFNYTFQVRNNGPLAAAGVAFDDLLPPSILPAGTVTVDNGTCTANPVAHTVHCDIGDLGRRATVEHHVCRNTDGGRRVREHRDGRHDRDRYPPGQQSVHRHRAAEVATAPRPRAPARRGARGAAGELLREAVNSCRQR